MTSIRESILSVIPGSHENERMVVAVRLDDEDKSSGSIRIHTPSQPATCCDECEQSEANVDDPIAVAQAGRRNCCGSLEKPIVIRQESFSSAVGWFAQSCIEMTEEQWVAMRSAWAVSMPAAKSRSHFGSTAAPVAGSNDRHESISADEPAVLPISRPGVA
ncbi:MAG: hypothetical protein AAF539_15190 [Planctomycetota bacterium]